MRLIDIAPFEELSPKICISYIGKDGMHHTLYAPMSDIPSYGSSAALPEYLQKAVHCANADSIPGRNSQLAETPALNTSIDELELSVRSYNCLMRANIKTVSELLAISEPELMKIRNMGKNSVKEIKDKLCSIGLRLAATDE